MTEAQQGCQHDFSRDEKSYATTHALDFAGEVLVKVYRYHEVRSI